MHAQRRLLYLICLCVFVSVTRHLTTRVIIRATNKLTYSAVDKVENFLLYTRSAIFLLGGKCACIGNWICHFVLILETSFASYMYMYLLDDKFENGI